MSQPTTTSSLLLPPPPSGRSATMLSPATTAPQRLTSSGSATGNPRNKCALKPGHSLMDWVRLGNSSVDLAGTCGRVMPISAEELARHNTRTDAWLAIRGQVFNVTRYMDFHPGGVDELMRGVGCDATKLFDDVHAWVNYQQLLAKCYIGPLRSVSKIVNIDNIKSLQLKIQADQDIKSFAKPSVDNEVVPRFDWIQRRAEITLFIFTRSCCNPGLVVRRKSPTQLELCVHIAHAVHSIAFELHQAVEWPPRAAQISSETGKIELCLTKTVPEPWSGYGAHSVSKVLPTIEDDNCIDFVVVRRDDFNHDSYELVLQSARDVLLLLPIAYHVGIAAPINGNYVEHSYTPVDSKYLNGSLCTAGTYNLNFLIKCYKGGVLSTHMQQLAVGATLKLSPPRGSLRLQKLLPHRRIALLAAGSGLTPFLSLITHLLCRNTNRLEELRLLYFNKTETDIWSREALALQAKNDERLQITHILSQADVTWQGLRGQVSNELLAPLTDKKNASYVSFIAVCGSKGFNQRVEELLQQLQFDPDNLHIFQG